MAETDVSALIAQIKELETENARLRAILVRHNIEYAPAPRGQQEDCLLLEKPSSKQCSSTQLSLQEKVSLFRSVFKGREDVFARRWYSATTQKSGYQPVCEREWKPDFCDKRKFKCAECPNRKFAPLSYNDIFNHLAGKDLYGRDVVGLYVIMRDDSCYFLCADVFWQSSALQAEGKAHDEQGVYRRRACPNGKDGASGDTDGGSAVRLPRAVDT